MRLFEHYVSTTLQTFTIAQAAMQQNLEMLQRMAPGPSDLLSGLAGLFRRGGGGLMLASSTLCSRRRRTDREAVRALVTRDARAANAGIREPTGSPIPDRR